MKLSEHKFLVDENIQNTVVDFMKDSGIDVFSVQENGLSGSTDSTLLEIAYHANRIIATHDSDFGTLAIANKQPVYGILYLKPGHINPSSTIDSIRAILDMEAIPIPSIITVKNTGQHINIRIRKL